MKLQILTEYFILNLMIDKYINFYIVIHLGKINITGII